MFKPKIRRKKSFNVEVRKKHNFIEAKNKLQDEKRKMKYFYNALQLITSLFQINIKDILK